MPIERGNLATLNSDLLTVLGAMIKTRSRVGLTDANHVLEHISARFFNAIHGWDLKNLNANQLNYPAADLGDEKRRIAVQVTNQASSRKIVDTRKKAEKHKLNKYFDRLIIFFLLPQKPSTPKKFTQLKDGPKIETWDIADVLKVMLSSNLGALRKAAQVLEEEMNCVSRHLRTDLGLENLHHGAPRPNRKSNQGATTGPILMARFQEDKGDLLTVEGDGNGETYWIDLWIDCASAATQRVDFEILDNSFTDNPWSIKRAGKSEQTTRDFLTDGMNSWGDVAILAKGRGRKNKELWFIESTLYQALIRFHGERSQTPEIKRALKQIRDN